MLIHASAVLIGSRALLIRGPSGSGKSALALRLVLAGMDGSLSLAFTRLVGDDQVGVEASSGRVLVSPAERLAGLLEVRGLGLRRFPYERLAQVGLIADLQADDTARLPDAAAQRVEICQVSLPRIAVAKNAEALSLILARLRSESALD